MYTHLIKSEKCVLATHSKFSLFTFGKERKKPMEMEIDPTYSEKKVIIREFQGERDSEDIEKLERDLKIGSRRGFSIFTNMMGDPLCRVRLYPNHIMLVGGAVFKLLLLLIMFASMISFKVLLNLSHYVFTVEAMF